MTTLAPDNGPSYVPTPGVFMRWKASEDPRSPIGRFNPLTPDHNLVGVVCQVCDLNLVRGQRPTLVVVGAADEDDNFAMHAGRWFNASCAVVHEACVWGSTS